MEHVVYLLGAGFSAELGIPVVANFLEVAKDLYRKDRERFGRFRPVFDRMRGLGHVKNFMHFDLDDVEEVLSLLQMESVLTSGTGARDFARLMGEVVRATTPPAPVFPLASKADGDVITAFESTRPWRTYLWFAASLLGVGLVYPTRDSEIRRTVVRSARAARYTLITMNYDLVLETAFDVLEGIASDKAEGSAPERPPILKLHGCVAKGNIIAPTANKSLGSAVKSDWKAAFTALREATHLRVIGYSLPTTDASMRYLLGSALSKAENPKSFDVLCKDANGIVRTRYQTMFPGRRLRFAGNVDTGAYLSALFGRGSAPFNNDSPSPRRSAWTSGSVEEAHAGFFRNYDRGSL